MKYNVGDIVRIKSLDWYGRKSDCSSLTNSDLILLEHLDDLWYNKLTVPMGNCCGKIMTISEVGSNWYMFKEDCSHECWPEEMIDCDLKEFVRKKAEEYVNSNSKLDGVSKSLLFEGIVDAMMTALLPMEE